MFRTLVVAAIVGVVAYHYGVDAGRQDAHLHHRAAVTDSSRAPVVDSRGDWLNAAPRHHPLAGDADSTRLAADGQRLVMTVQQKAHALTAQAINALPGAVVDKTANALDDAARYLDHSLQGRHADSWQEPGRDQGT